MSDTDLIARARDDLRMLKSGGYEHTAELVEGLINEVGNARRLWVKAEADCVELEAIVRDLAECRINAATPEALSVTRERAKDWVAAHPVSGDPQ